MYKLYPKTPDEVERWQEDYQFLGYNTSIKNNILSVWWGSKRTKKEKPERPERNKRLDKRKRD